MHNRLSEIVEYKTGGKQNEFAALLGWSPTYLGKLLRGDNFGLKPALTVLAAFPEVNARWFLLGSGKMLSDEAVVALRRTMHEKMSSILELERYMPVMSPEELREFEQIINGQKTADFSPETIERWESLHRQANEETEARFAAANKKSKELCSQKKAKK